MSLLHFFCNITCHINFDRSVYSFIEFKLTTHIPIVEGMFALIKFVVYFKCLITIIFSQLIITSITSWVITSNISRFLSFTTATNVFYRNCKVAYNTLYVIK